MSSSHHQRPALGITATERETGLSKDTLRVWERRYGFPRPDRDAHGERLYPAIQVDRLRLLKRLMDQGHRPGRLMAASEEELNALSVAAAAPTRQPATDPLLQQLMALVKGHDVPQLRSALNQAMLRQGLQDFVVHTLSALNRAVGEAWMSGEFEIFEEHLYTEQVQALLRQAIATLPTQQAGSPRILLTTVPEEQHGLGLLMAEALMALDGATCISLGIQTPLFDIAMAARAQQADMVALSFSSAYPSRQVAPQLAQLRALLPDSVELWAGGAGVERVQPQAGVQLLPSIRHAQQALAAWRASRTGSAGEVTPGA
ncbi:MAG: MerR family transcriptional regulator [Burkholderiaceae bacterium]